MVPRSSHDNGVRINLTFRFVLTHHGKCRGPIAILDAWKGSSGDTDDDDIGHGFKRAGQQNSKSVILQGGCRSQNMTLKDQLPQGNQRGVNSSVVYVGSHGPNHPSASSRTNLGLHNFIRQASYPHTSGCQCSSADGCASDELAHLPVHSLPNADADGTLASNSLCPFYVGAVVGTRNERNSLPFVPTSHSHDCEDENFDNPIDKNIYS